VEGDERAERRDGDDAACAARFESRIKLLARTEKPSQICVYQSRPFFVIDRESRLPKGCPGRVYDDVDAPEFLDDLVAELPDRIAIPNIRAVQESTAANFLNLRAGIREQLRPAARWDNIRAVLRQSDCDFLAKPGRGAKHDRHAVCQIEAISSHIVLNVSSTM
jgi:hypothetical protein